MTPARFALKSQYSTPVICNNCIYPGIHMRKAICSNLFFEIEYVCALAHTAALDNACLLSG